MDLSTRRTLKRIKGRYIAVRYIAVIGEIRGIFVNRSDALIFLFGGTR